MISKNSDFSKETPLSPSEFFQKKSIPRKSLTNNLSFLGHVT